MSSPLPNREIWLRAGTILAEYGDRSADYIIDQAAESLGDWAALEDWRRIAAAVDYIAGAEPQ
jgi:hypothetical protein